MSRLSLHKILHNPSFGIRSRASYLGFDSHTGSLQLPRLAHGTGLSALEVSVFRPACQEQRGTVAPASPYLPRIIHSALQRPATKLLRSRMASSLLPSPVWTPPPSCHCQTGRRIYTRPTSPSGDAGSCRWPPTSLCITPHHVIRRSSAAIGRRRRRRRRRRRGCRADLIPPGASPYPYPVPPLIPGRGAPTRGARGPGPLWTLKTLYFQCFFR